jgi:hypothetical protein
MFTCAWWYAGTLSGCRAPARGGAGDQVEFGVEGTAGLPSARPAMNTADHSGAARRNGVMATDREKFSSAC